MNKFASLGLPLLILVMTAACDIGTDAATRLAHDIEVGVNRLGNVEGAASSIYHKTPSKRGECTGPYKIQLDRAGALIIWCKDVSGNTVSSHSTSYHARFVDTLQTYIVDKAAGEMLTIDIKRRGGRVIVTGVH